MKFFTFCVDIGKHSKQELETSLIILLNSLEKNVKDYKIICYSNYLNSETKKLKYSNYNIEFREYYDRTINPMYSSKWLNLSFNKINVCKDLMDEFKESYVWIDIDTIVAYDISYLNEVDNFFVPINGPCRNKNLLFVNDSTITVPRCDYIQSHFWKISSKIHKELFETLDEIKSKNLILRFDIQDLFGYHLYVKNFCNTLNILGKNYKTNTLNSLSVWSPNGNSHANINGLNNLYFDGRILRTTYEKDKEIHVLSFTMETMKKLINTQKFKELFGDLF